MNDTWLPARTTNEFGGTETRSAATTGAPSRHGVGAPVSVTGPWSHDGPPPLRAMHGRVRGRTSPQRLRRCRANRIMNAPTTISTAMTPFSTTGVWPV